MQLQVRVMAATTNSVSKQGSEVENASPRECELWHMCNLLYALTYFSGGPGWKEKSERGQQRELYNL